MRKQVTLIATMNCMGVVYTFGLLAGLKRED